MKYAFRLLLKMNCPFSEAALELSNHQEIINRKGNVVLKQVQRSPSQVKGEGLKILSRRGSPVQIRPAAPIPLSLKVFKLFLRAADWGF